MKRINSFNIYRKQNENIYRTKSQQQLSQLLNKNYTIHRRSLPHNIYHHATNQSSIRFRSSSMFLSNISNFKNHTTYFLHLLYQIIEHEAAIILEHFLKTYRHEFNNHFHTKLMNVHTIIT